MKFNALKIFCHNFSLFYPQQLVKSKSLLLYLRLPSQRDISDNSSLSSGLASVSVQISISRYQLPSKSEYLTIHAAREKLNGLVQLS